MQLLHNAGELVVELLPHCRSQGFNVGSEQGDLRPFAVDGEPHRFRVQRRLIAFLRLLVQSPRYGDLDAGSDNLREDYAKLFIIVPKIVRPRSALPSRLMSVGDGAAWLVVGVQVLTAVAEGTGQGRLLRACRRSAPCGGEPAAVVPGLAARAVIQRDRHR